MKRRLLFSGLLLCIVFSSDRIANGQEFGIAGRSNSQILRAYESRSIVVGEVVYIGSPVGSGFSIQPLGTQTIVYKLAEVVKGQMEAKLFNVAVSIVLSNGDMRNYMAPGQKHILLLDKISESFCTDKSLNLNTKSETTEPEFNKYKNLDCYFLESSSVIDSNPQEMKAVRVFAKK